MDEIRHFELNGTAYPVAFPFEAMSELVGERSYIDYARIHESPVHQMRAFQVGMKYGHKLEHGGKIKLSPQQLTDLAKANQEEMYRIWRVWDRVLFKHLEMMNRLRTEEEEQEEGEGKP